MLVYVPDYYPLFSCIADQCRHSCCEGWGIDIDPVSAQRYAAMQGELGEKLHAVICPAQGDEPAHYILLEGDRCPFLQDDGLCEMILKAGEDCLCDICRDHPRFRNFFSDRTEMGLGLACEESARIILSRKEKMTLIPIEDDGEPAEEPTDEETALTALRSRLIAILQDRSMPVDSRVLKMLAAVGIGSDKVTFSGEIDAEIEKEQLGVYFLFRHLADALYDGNVAGRVLLAARFYATVRNAWAKQGALTLPDKVEIVRAFSADIEYDTNMAIPDPYGEQSL